MRKHSSSRSKDPRRFVALAGATLLGAAVLSTVAEATPSWAATGWSSALTRYPYLTDATTSSVQVTWADTYASTYGAVTWGTASSNCATNTVKATKLGTKFTVGSTSEYQHSVAITGLSAGTQYCYRIKGGSGNSVDLLGTQPSPSFRDLPSSGSYSFLVFGDWGDTSTSPNTGQASLDAQIAHAASAGALFGVGTGDIAYPTGTPTQYGDLNQTGTNVSAVFGPDYWRQPGSLLPFFTTPGNHGRTSTFFQTWPEPATVAASGGTYGLMSYPSVDGDSASTAPADWYAFSAGNARFYVLTADWSDTNTGSATGALCQKQFSTRTRPDYQVEADSEWATSGPQYTWLKNDLQSHHDQLKFAFFHYPLRSDDATEPGDPYLQNRPDNPHSPNSLEALLTNNGVDLAFNGHAHIYQRNLAPPNGVVSYVTGGGGAKLVPVAKNSRSSCSSTDAYALGWSYSSAKGSSCGSAPTPTSTSQVFHFLKVTVNGASVTVTPTDADGNTFDTHTYNFGADSSAPGAPSSVAAKYVPATSSKAGYGQVTWAASSSSDVTDYDIYRQDPGDGSPHYVDTVDPSKTSYNDATAAANTAYVYSVQARDQAGNVSAMVSAPPLGSGGGSDTAPPSQPGNLTATASGSSQVDLTWSASTDNVGVTGYNVYRNGTKVATVTGTTYSDTGLTASTTYNYAVEAFDAAGNTSTQATASATSGPGGGGGGGSFTFAPTDDATIDGANPSTHVASTSRLTADDSPVNDFLLKFNVDTNACTISGATLRLTVGSSTNNNSAHGGVFYGTDNAAWSESNVTWSNAPQTSGASVASLGSVDLNSTQTVNVSPLVKSDGPVTIRVSTTSADAVAYFSKETGTADTAPQLQVTCA